MNKHCKELELDGKLMKDQIVGAELKYNLHLESLQEALQATDMKHKELVKEGITLLGLKTSSVEAECRMKEAFSVPSNPVKRSTIGPLQFAMKLTHGILPYKSDDEIGNIAPGEELVVKISDLPSWAQHAFEGMKPLNGIQTT